MAQIIDPMATLQSYQTADQMNALRAQQMDISRMQEQRASALQPFQIQAQQMNILAKRMAMEDDMRRRNALQQYSATGNINALAMADPKIAMQMQANRERNDLLRQRLAGNGKRPNYIIKETANGLVRINPDTLEVSPLAAPGGAPLMGAKTEKALTESQGNATGFGMRAARSDEILRGLEDQGVTDTGILRGAAGRMAGVLPIVGDKLAEGVASTTNMLPSALGGPNPLQRQTEQARRDFVNAILRKESGATISPAEFENASKQYFPQPGDDAKTIEQKRGNRESALESLRVQAGPGGEKIPRRKLPEMPAPSGIDAKLWAVMTPDERKLWQTKK